MIIYNHREGEIQVKMKKVKRLYCVINTNGDIVGRFINKNRAINYMIDYWFDSCDDKATIKEMTAEEYLIYTRKLIDK